MARGRLSAFSVHWCILTVIGSHAGLTVRYDLLEELLTPLERLPDKNQFFAFLTSEDGRSIPVSALAYNLVILGVFQLLALFLPVSCKV